MNLEKFTQKSLQAIQEAQSLALSYKNMQIEQEHLLYALLTQKDGLIPEMIRKLNINLEGMIKAVKEKIARLPSVTGSGREPGKIYVSSKVEETLINSETIAKI